MILAKKGAAHEDLAIDKDIKLKIESCAIKFQAGTFTFFLAGIYISPS